MKKIIFLASAIFFLSVSNADAQMMHSSCPSQNLYYSNGYYMNYCVPSYYPSYPQYMNYQNNYGGWTTNVQYNPFQPASQYYYNDPRSNAFNPATYYYPQTYYGGHNGWNVSPGWNRWPGF